MDDQRIGIALRSIRVRRGWRQADLAARAGVSRSLVGQIEHGRLARVPLASVRGVAMALDVRLDVTLRWHGGDLGRLLNARHAAMHEAVARSFAARAGWTAEPEVSFSVYGERGVIDVLAWHAQTRTLLVIELKTELVDVNDLMGTMDRRRRLAMVVARDRHWDARTIATWVVLADSRTNRRALATHEAVLRSKFPADGRRVRGWLNCPAGPIDALSFLPYELNGSVRRDLGPIRRVSRQSGTRRRA